MTLLQALLLGILQGATEFLPISSSGHLVIVPALLGWPDPGLLLDTVLHLGTLAAVVIYFWRDLVRLVMATWQSLRQRSLADPQARLAWALVIGTLPAALLGFLLESTFERLFGMPRAAAAFLLGTAVVLVVAEFLARRERSLEHITWWHALAIGGAQALAIAPGLSRSGMTMAAGLLLGYRREEATRFSFLLSIPIILGNGGYQLLKAVRGGPGGTEVAVLGAGFLAAAVTGYLVIAGLLAYVRRRSLWPFAVYCAVLGLLVLTGLLG